MKGKKNQTAAEPPERQQPQSFDAILRQLQEIVERLEGEEMALEESLKAFEQGMELSRRGQQILDTAEQKVEVLLKDGSTEALES